MILLLLSQPDFKSKLKFKTVNIALNSYFTLLHYHISEKKRADWIRLRVLTLILSPYRHNLITYVIDIFGQ